MRKPLLLSGAFLAATLLTATFSTAKQFVYVAAAEDGVIDRYELDPASGALTPLGETAAGKRVMPMALSPDKPVLYAVVRSEPFRVLTFAIDPATGDLSQTASAALPASMAYASTDRAGRFLFTSSYDANEIAVSPIDPDGSVRREAAQVIPTGKMAHSIGPDRTNSFVFVPNLGSDQVMQFRFDASTGSLTPNDPPLVRTEPGDGPRHIAVSPDNKTLYVLCELSGNVIQFGIDDAGRLTALDSVKTVPADAGLVRGAADETSKTTVKAGGSTAGGDETRAKIWAADIAITPDGRFMYTTERTKSHVALLSIAPANGRLTYLRNYPVEQQPRGIRMDAAGKYLIVTGEKSDHVSSYRIDGGTGELSLVGRYPVGADANWAVVFEAP